MSTCSCCNRDVPAVVNLNLHVGLDPWWLCPAYQCRAAHLIQTLQRILLERAQ